MPGATETDRGDDFVPTDDTEVDNPIGDTAAAALEVELAAAEAAKGIAKASADATSDTEDAEDAEDAKPKPKQDTRMPLARHKEILEKERAQRAAVEQENTRLRQGTKLADTNEQLTTSENTLMGLEKEYAKLVVDGDAVQAAEKMREIRMAERSISETKANFNIQAAEARAYERVKYDTTVERLEAAYPAINPDHDDFDEELTTEIVELRDGYVATGKYSRAEAIQKAAKTLLGTRTTRQETAVVVDVKVDKADLAKATAEERRLAQLKKNVDAATKQPASTAKVGLDSDKIGGTLSSKEVMKMNQDQFAKLSETDLARIRGDELV